MTGKAELSGDERRGAKRLDCLATDFRAICGERLLALARIERRERVLDVATSASLDFPDENFDAVICNLGIAFLPDMLAGLEAWWRVTKPGGRAMFSSLGASAFRPLTDLLDERLRGYGVSLPSRTPPLSTQRLLDPEECRGLLLSAGFDHVEVRTEQLGYYARDPHQWWEIAGNGGFFHTAHELLAAEALEQFTHEHLAEVDALATEQGIWIDLATIFASGRKE